MAENKTIRLGFVGAGDMAQQAHIVNYWNRPGVALAALADGRTRTAELVARAYGIRRTYPDHRELLRHAEVDAVVAILPFALNPGVVEDTLNAGKSVLTEKPQCLTAETGLKLANLAERRGLHYHVGYMKRFDPGVQWARAKIADWMERSNEIGPLQSLRIWCAHGSWDWFRPPRLDGGDPLPEYAPRLEPRPDWMEEAAWQKLRRWTNYYSHQTNLARYLVGTDYALDTVKQVDNSFFVQNTFQTGGAQLYFDFAAFATDRWDEGFEAVFERAKLTAAIPAPLAPRQAARVVAYEFPEGGAPGSIEPSYPAMDGFARQAEHFVALLRGDAEPMSPASEAVKELEYAEALVRRMQEEGKK